MQRSGELVHTVRHLEHACSLVIVQSLYILRRENARKNNNRDTPKANVRFQRSERLQRRHLTYVKTPRKQYQAWKIAAAGLQVINRLDPAIHMRETDLVRIAPDCFDQALVGFVVADGQDVELPRGSQLQSRFRATRFMRGSFCDPVPFTGAAGKEGRREA